MISFWERNSFLAYDYIIVGSGITGLSTAASIKENQPNASVLVLERGIFPSGASTKNAGFACIGSLTEVLHDLQTMSEKQVLKLMEQRLRGLNKLRNRLGDTAIDYQAIGSYELIGKQQLACLHQLEQVNDLLYPLLRQNAYKLAHKSLLQQFGFNQKYVEALIINQCEGQIDTGKMMHQLIKYVNQLGVTIINGAMVDNIEDEGNRVVVSVYHNNLKEQVLFLAKKVAVCTNAFTRKLLPNIVLSPGRGQVLVTHPINELPFKGIFHFEEGYYYFRNFGNRVIFGGGRNIDFEEETTTNFAINQRIIADLTEKLKTVILPNTPFAIDCTWAGIMAFGKAKVPVLADYTSNIGLGVRMGGMGIAIGSDIGQQLASRLCQSNITC